MNWYRIAKIQSDESIVDLVFGEWKKTSFDANVNTLIQRIYQTGVPADANRDKLSDVTEEVVKELASEDGELQLWHKVMKDKRYYAKLKNAINKLYRKKVEEIEKAKRGPLQINTPQTPSQQGGPGGAPGGGAPGAGMLM